MAGKNIKSKSMPTGPAPTLGVVLDDVKKYLDHEKEEGRTAFQVEPPASTGRQAQSVSRVGGGVRDLAAIAGEIAQCRKCRLNSTRTNTVPGQGNPHPEILFVGEGPGEDEDLSGLAFVGAAGKLLTKMITAMGFTREEVFIANIVKCRPPGNRQPAPEEMAACMPYLKEQISILKPKVMITLGGVSTKALLGVETGIMTLRGKWKKFDGIDLMPTYHPSYLLRLPSAKKDVWEDLKAVLKRLGREVPPAVPKA